MIIGIPKEIKNNENRIALTPKGTALLIKKGHEVFIEKDAGIGSGFIDQEYKKAGAKIVTAQEAWNADIIVKVKEPLPQEYRYFKNNQIIFTYLHLAGAQKSLTEALIQSGCIAIAYETVEKNGSLPLLKPMSEVAGKIAIQEGSKFMLKMHGGQGILLDKIFGVIPANVVIIGAGASGTAAAVAAAGRGATVTLLDINKEKLARLKKEIRGNVHTIISTKKSILKAVKKADLLVGAVLIPGRKAPKIITEKMIKSMKYGSVFVDISIDQGGCAETSRPTTHENPVFTKYGITHYCVTNMPGIVPRTSTLALTSATLPYILKITNQGVEKLALHDNCFAKGINVYKGNLVSKPVAESLKMKYSDLTKII
ncbi:MAG: alanine dehydrogenase [Patescibacteria group bacterium]